MRHKTWDDHGEAYGVDTEHVFAVGDSAGEHMLCMYAAICTNPEYAAETDMINPLPYITGDFPTAYIMTANNDRMVESAQAQMLETRLREQRVDFSPKVYGTEEKTLDHVFHCNVRMEEGNLCNEEECAFFRSFL